MAEDQADEARVRRAAKRVDWRIEKSRVRNLHINDRGRWQRIDDRNKVIGGADYDASLADCADWIEVERQRLAA